MVGITYISMYLKKLKNRKEIVNTDIMCDYYQIM
jgi:hypothetical protein